MLAAVGCPPEEIAEVLGCSRTLLYSKRFVTQLERGRAIGRQKVRAKQYEVAMKGSAQMLIWLGKQMLGQADKIDYTNTSNNDLISEAKSLFGGDLQAILAGHIEASPLED